MFYVMLVKENKRGHFDHNFSLQSKHNFFVCLLAHFDPFKLENLRFETKFWLEMFLGLGLWLNQIGM